jgi:hypothetical protein
VPAPQRPRSIMRVRWGSYAAAAGRGATWMHTKGRLLPFCVLMTSSPFVLPGCGSRCRCCEIAHVRQLPAHAVTKNTQTKNALRYTRNRDQLCYWCTWRKQGQGKLHPRSVRENLALHPHAMPCTRLAQALDDLRVCSTKVTNEEQDEAHGDIS